MMNCALKVDSEKQETIWKSLQHTSHGAIFDYVKLKLLSIIS
ncbi:hypothetical protein QFZ28_005894 [Neobacillus niacini]|nr:hypothetical protein [Neobacillus niacini]